MKRELNPIAFWAILAGVAAVVLGGVFLLANPNTGERAPAGGPPPTPQSSRSAAPPPPPPQGFPTG